MKIQLKRSNTLDSGSAKEPTAGQMEYGELAVNYNDTDPAVFLKDSNNNIIRIAGLGSVGSDKIPSGDSLPSGKEPGSVFFNTSDDILYYWNGSSWVAINGDDVYVDVSGDNMTGNLTLGTDKISLNASTGDGIFAGKITSAATASGDSSTTVATKGYVDSSGTVAGDGKLTVKTSGEEASSTGTFTANQSGDSSLTLPTIRYQDLSGAPSVPDAAGTGTLNIKDSTGASLGTFNANAASGTETVISLPGGVAPSEPGDGGLTIKNYGDNSAATGDFSANQSGNSTLTLKQIKYADLSGTPSIPSAANNGTITIKQPGTSDQTFTVNQSSNTTVTLKNDNTIVTPGSGGLTIKNFNDSTGASGSFNANQSSGSTLTLKQIKYSDVSGTPSIPSAAQSGTLNIKDATGTSLGTFNANATTGTETVISLPASVVPTEPGAGGLTIKNFNDSNAASGSFNANQSSGSTVTLKQIKYSDVSGTPSIPSAANNGTITIKQGSATKGTFTVNQSGNTTVTVDAAPAAPATNLGNSTTSTTVKVTSSTGNDTTIAAASGSIAGVMTTTQVSDLSTAKSTASSASSAATAAQSTANTAVSDASAANTNANNRVSKSGDTMTGDLTITDKTIKINKSGGNLTLRGGNNLGIENTGVLGLYSRQGNATGESSIVMDGNGLTLSQASSQTASGIRYSVGNAWIGWQIVNGVGVELVYNNTAWFTVQAQYSDRRLKKDIATLTPDGGALSVINKLNPVEYRWKDVSPWYSQRQLDINPEGTLKWGFIAQEVGEVIPEALVIPDATEKKPDPKADYDVRALVSILTKAVQELSAEVEALKSAGTH